jgi:TrmH family RNA methyltransferase
VPLGTWDELQGTRVALEAHRGVPPAELSLEPPVVFLLGAERAGLPAEVVRDAEARIPVEGAESLNVAAAGAIALYELRRRA